MSSEEFDQDLDTIVKQCLISSSSSNGCQILTEDDLQKGGITTPKTTEDETHVCEQIVKQSKALAIKVLLSIGADTFLANVLKGLHVIFDNRDGDNNNNDQHNSHSTIDDGDEVRAIEYTRALHVVYGALHNIVDQQQTTMKKENKATSTTLLLSDSTKDLIGTFLVSYCGYGTDDHDDSDDDNDEVDAVQQMKYNVLSGHVRTIALECVTLLVQCCSGNEILLEISNLLLAQHGMEHYLGISQFLQDQEISDSDYSTLVSNHMASLVRIQRTKCITLLQTALRHLTSTTTASTDDTTMVTGDGAANTTISSSSTTMSSSSPSTASVSPLKAIRQFIVLCASLLHGETDPRCIQQIFQLLHECQITFCVSTTTIGKDDASSTTTTTIYRWLQRQERSWSQESNELLNYFPTVTVFDAIAPYYPIQFTPPSNDPYGISRNDLRHALSLVLCHPSLTLVGQEDSTSNTTTTMTCFACGLILEQLEVLPDNGEDEIDDDDDIMDGFSSKKDVQYMEALEDLRQLLLLKDRPSTTTSTISLLPSQMMTNLSDSLVDVFVKSMYNFVTKQHMNEKLDEDDEADDDNPSSDGSSSHNPQQGTPLSRACLEFVVDLMNDLEVSPQWDSFTSTTKLNNLVLSITSTPESINAKIGLIYICRGLCMKSHKARTKFIIETCVPPLMEKVIQYGQDRYQYRTSNVTTTPAPTTATTTTKKQYERIQASLLSLSACLTVLGNPVYTIDGVPSYPPKYSLSFITDMKDLLTGLLEIGCLFNKDEDNGHPTTNVAPSSFLQPMAPFAINTLECFVLCFTTAKFVEEQHDNNDDTNNDAIVDFHKLQTIVQQLTAICCGDENGNDETNNNDVFSKWQMSCAHALGSLLGGRLLLRSMDDDDDNEMNDVENLPTNNNKLELVLGKTCLTKLIEWCCGATTTISSTAASCSALARACHVSSSSTSYENVTHERTTQATQSHVATMIVHQIWSTLMNNKTNHHFECGLHCLAHVLEHGGMSAKIAWRTTTTAHDSDSGGVIKNLLQQIMSMSNSNHEHDASVTHSNTTTTTEPSTNTLITSLNICFEQLSGIEQVGSEIVSCLLQLYNKNDGSIQQQQLRLTLQCLSAYLSSPGSPIIGPTTTQTTTTSTNQSLMNVIPLLIHLIRHSNNNNDSNNQVVLASNCLYQILVLTNTNLNSLGGTTTMLDETNKMTDTCSSTTTTELLLEREFHIHAIVAAASFYKGGSSSMLGDEYLKWFLSLILWDGSEQQVEEVLQSPPQSIIDDSTTTIDWTNVFSSTTTTTNDSLPLLASQAIGTILSCNGNNDQGSPFRQQRIAFQLIPTLMEHLLRSQPTTHKQSSSTMSSELSCYLVLSMVTCNTPLTILKEGGCFGNEVNDESQPPPLIQCMTLLIKGLEQFVPRLICHNQEISNEYLVSFCTITVAAIFKCIYGTTSTEDSTSSTMFNNSSPTFAKDLIAIYLLLLTVGEEEDDDETNNHNAMDDETEDGSGTSTNHTTTITIRMIPCTLLILESLLVLKTTNFLLSSSSLRGGGTPSMTVLTTLITNVCRRTVLDHPSHLVREAAVRVQNVWLSSSLS